MLGDVTDQRDRRRDSHRDGFLVGETGQNWGRAITARGLGGPVIYFFPELRAALKGIV